MLFWSTTMLTDRMSGPKPRTEPLIYGIDMVAFVPMDQFSLFPKSITS